MLFPAVNHQLGESPSDPVVAVILHTEPQFARKGQGVSRTAKQVPSKSSEFWFESFKRSSLSVPNVIALTTK
jgi:hypothetical protein